MKISAFHLMPHRELPEDFERRHPSVLIEEVVKGLRVGNLMILVQIGSMPHELTLKNIDLFAREVLPSLREVLVKTFLTG
jgi:hypothetical protein